MKKQKKIIQQNKVFIFYFILNLNIVTDSDHDLEPGAGIDDYGEAGEGANGTDNVEGYDYEVTDSFKGSQWEYEDYEGHINSNYIPNYPFYIDTETFALYSIEDLSLNVLNGQWQTSPMYGANSEWINDPAMYNIPAEPNADNSFNGTQSEQYDSLNNIPNPNWIPNYPYYVDIRDGTLLNIENPDFSIAEGEWENDPNYGGNEDWIDNPNYVYNVPDDPETYVPGKRKTSLGKSTTSNNECFFLLFFIIKLKKMKKKRN
jgi:hypothetical protein